MLPEYQKKLKITIIALFVLIFTIIIIAFISNIVKNNNKNKELSNDTYNTNFDYIGVVKDDNNIYNLYGVKNEVETNLNLTTFYKVEDIKYLNGKVIIYSDAVNEIRYDKSDDKYYFYELDSYYSSNYSFKLANSYLVGLDKENNLYYDEYGNNFNNKKLIARG